MAVAEITNLVIEKGVDFEVTFNLFNNDSSVSTLSGLSTTYATIRKYPTSSSYEEFSKSITGSTGTITLSLTSGQTANLSEGRNYFDVVLTINSKRVKVIRGSAMVYESVSV